MTTATAEPTTSLPTTAAPPASFGFVLLAVGSTRFSDQPQRWALAPGVAAAVVGLAMWLFSPSEHTLALAGWVWPGLLLVLVGWSFRGARRSLHSWARPALLYPALVVLLSSQSGGVRSGRR